MTTQTTLWTEFSFILKPSPIAGIGVFATHDLLPNVLLLSRQVNFRKLKKSDVAKDFIPYCILLNNDEVLCPERFDRMEIGWYINHSDEPNIKKIEDKGIITIKHIYAGDEILLNYNDLNEPENLKEHYYKK